MKYKPSLPSRGLLGTVLSPDKERVTRKNLMPKTRLTITLDEDILKRVDAAIDGSKIRNRSHAIEFLLTSCLIPQSSKVLILAGGEGVRFRPLTNELPKSLLPIAGRPLLEHTIQSLKAQGLTDIYISVAHLGDKIEDYFGDGSKFGVKIKYLEQAETKTGTAQPLLQAKHHFTDPFLVIYGDVLTKINYLDLLDFHSSHRGIATMALTSVEKPSMWGVATIEGNRIKDFVEKPKNKTRSHLINAGIYVLNPDVFKYFDQKAVRLEKDLFPRLALEGKLYAYPFEGVWYDVSTPQIYAEVMRDYKA